LITAGTLGLWRWSIPEDHPGAPAMAFGAGQRLQKAPMQHFGLSADGQFLAVAVANRGVSVFPLSDLSVDKPVLEHALAIIGAVSRAGRWAAAGTWNGHGVRVWDMETGAQSDLLKDNRMATVAFSPDDRWLVTGGNHEFCFWEIGTWQLRRRIPRTASAAPGTIAFAPSGRILALQIGDSQVRFYDHDSCEELYTLDSPNGEHLGSMAFLPDGSGFVAVSGMDDHVHFWDLALIRRRLAALGLDWNDPARLR